MRVLEPLEQIKFLSHPVPPHQLLVDMFDRHCTFGAALVTTLDNRETPPGEERGSMFSRQLAHFRQVFRLLDCFHCLIQIPPHKKHLCGIF